MTRFVHTQQQLGGSSGGADIVYQRKTKAQRAPEAAAAAEPAPISKSMQRKLDSIQVSCMA